MQRKCFLEHASELANLTLERSAVGPGLSSVVMVALTLVKKKVKKVSVGQK